ncbi:hypothetical protein ACSIGC_08855 [Tenacibaculum sp. ZS6-P6]|uniref:hypothetical protein n=1 Tax=Tenacibaculum sp. ZS6-P6 TaxID=3447503 RepID=UPI003F98DC0F
MKKSILNIGKALNKAEQRKVNGGFGSCDDYTGPFCYADSIPGCASCAEYNALPRRHKACAFTHAECEIPVNL